MLVRAQNLEMEVDADSRESVVSSKASGVHHLGNMNVFFQQPTELTDS